MDATDGRLYCALGALSFSGLSGPGAGGIFWSDDRVYWTEAGDLSGKHVSSLIIDDNDSDKLLFSISTPPLNDYTSDQQDGVAISSIFDLTTLT